MVDDKVACMLKAKEYEFDYWDGDRRFGYGGYKYLAGRWKPVAQALIDTYGLKAGSRVLDVGCGKGFLLYEMQLLEPGLEIVGFDISKHGLASVHPELKANLFLHRAQDSYPFEDKSFDLVISLATLHNLRIFELQTALSEIQRVGKQGYIMLESYRAGTLQRPVLGPHLRILLRPGRMDLALQTLRLHRRLRVYLFLKPET
jgi:SAM-dependent methyltransferase